MLESKRFNAKKKNVRKNKLRYQNMEQNRLEFREGMWLKLLNVEVEKICKDENKTLS